VITEVHRTTETARRPGLGQPQTRDLLFREVYAFFIVHLALRRVMTSDHVTVAFGGELDPGLIQPLTGDDDG